MTISLLAHPAHAFAPDVPRALARAALAGDPTNEGTRLLGEAAAAAVDARLASEEAAPEAYAASHVYFAPAANDAIAFGTAPTALASAYEALTQGFASGDPARIVGATAALAIAASDLADPFRTAGPARSGAAGAWARFADAPGQPDAFFVAATPGTPVADVRAAALSLAARSAALRDSVEALDRSGRMADLSMLRRGRLDDALQLTCSLVGAARQTAANAALEAAAGPLKGNAFVLPNPARAHALLAFRTTGAGTARVQVISASGRRVAEFEQPVEAGAATIALDGQLPSGLAPGAYFARVVAPGVNTVARFIRLTP